MTGARFRRRARLGRPNEYRRVFASGCRCTNRYFTVIAAANNQCYARLGLAVSRRNTRRAVDRNRLKRLIRETFRVRQGELGGLDIVVLVHQGAAVLGNGGVRLHLHRLFETVSRKCAHS